MISLSKPLKRTLLITLGFIGTLVLLGNCTTTGNKTERVQVTPPGYQEPKIVSPDEMTEDKCKELKRKLTKCIQKYSTNCSITITITPDKE